MSTFTVSRDRQKPASSIVKPACMPNTRNAATSVQTVLIGFTMSLPASAGASSAWTSAPIRFETKAMLPSNRRMPSTFPPISRYP